MRDMKQRERKQQHKFDQNEGMETAKNGNNGTKLQVGGTCET